MQKTVFITGNSSGIGYALTEACLRQGWSVYGLSRRGCQELSGDLHDARCDLGDPAQITRALEKLLTGIDHLDLVILNAGVLGEMRTLGSTPMTDIDSIMNINVWANKLILDWLTAGNLDVEQVVAMSSGAAVNGNKGWSGYSLSKATLNMLIKLYAAELPDTHFISLAPGLVDTAMQDYLCDENKVSAQDFPSVEKLRSARGTEQMPTPRQAAANLMEVIPRLRQFHSGAFIDVRDL